MTPCSPPPPWCHYSIFKLWCHSFYDVNPWGIVTSLFPCAPWENSLFYTTHYSKISQSLPPSEPCSRTGDSETFVVWLCGSVGCASGTLPWGPSRRFIAKFIFAASSVSWLIFSWIGLDNVLICNYKLHWNGQTNNHRWYSPDSISPQLKIKWSYAKSTWQNLNANEIGHTTEWSLKVHSLTGVCTRKR